MHPESDPPELRQCEWLEKVMMPTSTSYEFYHSSMCLLIEFYMVDAA